MARYLEFDGPCEGAVFDEVDIYAGPAEEAFYDGFWAGVDAICFLASQSSSLTEFFERVKKRQFSNPRDLVEKYDFEKMEYSPDAEDESWVHRV